MDLEAESQAVDIMRGCSRCVDPESPALVAPAGLNSSASRTGTGSELRPRLLPARRLDDVFKAIHNLPDPAAVMRLPALHEVDFLPPPG